MKSSTKENSSHSESCSNRIDYNLLNDDSEIVTKTLHSITEKKLLITKKRNLKFYSRVLLATILSSLYYCLMLSVDREIELVTAKIFHSIIVLILTIIEFYLLQRNPTAAKKSHEEELITLSDKKYLKGFEEHQCEMRDLNADNTYEEIDLKEMFFYNVIYGMLTFTSELLLYYFLSLSISFNVNIGTMYTLTVVEYLFLIMRLPYFGVSLGLFQYVGITLTILLTGMLFMIFIPEYNVIVVIFTSITVSLFKFIQFCIFEYIHDKTRDAGKLIRQSSYVDGLIGLLLLFFILISKKPNLLIQDMGNLMKVILASFFYYFALKMAIHKERLYFNYVIYSSFNFIFISLLDFLINGRHFIFLEITLVTLVSIFSTVSFIHDSSFKKGFSRLFFDRNE